MSEWEGKSDFEINKAVSDIVDHHGMVVYLNEDQQLVYLCESSGQFDINPVCNFDPCNNPQDAWPIIFDSKISVVDPVSAGLESKWLASKFYPSTFKDDIDCDDKNPLRAAMIVYLEMNGVKP